MVEYCDLVMKGGITSGVVYPKAIVELSTRYRFKNIGGTSAGAIAAAATAAAEFRRRKLSSDEGYKKLAGLPETLAVKGFLVSLFQPDRTTRPLFDTVLAMMGAQNVMVKAIRVVWALLKGFPILGGCAALVAIMIWSQVRAPAPVYWILGVIWTLSCALAVSLVAATRFVPRALHDNQFGLCSGFDARAATGTPPLVNWLYGYLNELAGKPPAEPLTFGDLWLAPQDDGEIKTPRAINLELMTTNLTHGTPYRVPFGDDVARQFYFPPAVWKRFFPREVIQHLEAHSDPDLEPPPRTHDRIELKRLPPMNDLPIIVAVRLSLSFPILFSALPLYAVDYSRPQNRPRTPGEPPTAEPCWFSDGGICSNFPIHFFDAPLSRWPTFGIDLKSPHPDHMGEGEDVWLPSTNGQGQQPSWNRFDAGEAATAIFGFLHAIISTMQNWRDNLQMRMPGYRNRIVHVSHTKEEGGVNLNMPPKTIEGLSDRGRRAGLKLRTEFDFANHAWVRYRSCLSTLISFIEQFADHYSQPVQQDNEIWPTIRQDSDAPPPRQYKWRTTRDAALANATNRILLDIAADHQALGPMGDDGAPRPLPELRVVPRV